MSMDAIARQLRMSKKTIYQLYKDKRSLVAECFSHDLNQRKQACMEACSRSEHAIQQFLDISEFINRNIREMDADHLHDLHRLYPESWKKMTEFQNGFVLQFLEENFRLGIEQGYYRSDLEPPLAARLFVQSIQHTIHSRLHRELEMTMGDAHYHVYMYHLHAICSAKGVDYLKHHIAA